MIKNNKIGMDAAKKFPYDFVPLENWLCLPEWSKGVSHDIPFSDGLSGKISFTLHNITPICVGDTHKEKEALKMAKQNGKYIIPGTSIKGMIRNVLEAATFGKFNNFDDRLLSHRIEIDKFDSAEPIFIRFHSTEGAETRWEYKKSKEVYPVREKNLLVPNIVSNAFNPEADAVDKYISVGCKEKLIPFYAEIDQETKTIKKFSKAPSTLGDTIVCEIRNDDFSHLIGVTNYEKESIYY